MGKAAVGLAVALVLATAACGGGGGSTSGSPTTTSSQAATVQWAGGVCTAFTNWKTSLNKAAADVRKTGPSRAAINRAERQISDATTKLTRSLRQLGKPETAAGEAARKNLDTLSNQLSTGLNKIQETLKSNSSGTAGALIQVATVTATLSTMVHDLTTAVGKLKQSEPSGELEQAFHKAGSCSALFG